MGNTHNPQAWSKTAADNDDADAGINYAEGQAPSTLNNAGRGGMTGIANLLDDIHGGLVSSGTDTLTLTTNQGLSASHIAAGLSLAFRVANTNTGATTLNVDSTGAVAVVTQDGSALTGGELVAGMVAVVMYQSVTSNWRLVSMHPTTVNNDNWSGADLAVANGGTGQSTAAAAIDDFLEALPNSGYSSVVGGLPSGLRLALRDLSGNWGYMTTL